MMDRPEVTIVSLKVSEMQYTANIELINRPIQGKAQNYILVSKSPAMPEPGEITIGENILSAGTERRQWEQPIPKEVVEEILDTLEHANIPPYRTTSVYGFDGISYTISFGGGACYSKYHWCLQLPAGWKPLEELANFLYFHSGKLGYGSY